MAALGDNNMLQNSVPIAGFGCEPARPVAIRTLRTPAARQHTVGD